MSNGYLDPSLYTEQDVKPPGLEAYQHAPLAQGVQQMAPMQHQAQTAQMNSSPVPGMPPDAAMPPQSDVDEFLKKKRKAREHKACYPCRQRKVKCDLSRPCQTCRDREHPELCSYHPPNKRQNVDASAPQMPSVPRPDDMYGQAGAGAGNVVLGRGEFDMLCRKLSGLENSIAELRREIAMNSHNRTGNGGQAVNQSYDPALYGSEENTPRAPVMGTKMNGVIGQTPQHFQKHYETHGVHTKDATGNTVHFGAGSIPAFLLAMQDGNPDQPELQESLGKSIIPMFGLDNESATYPFVDLWGLPHGSLARAQELAKALPGDSQLLSFFRFYRDVAYVIFPGIVSLDQFEQDINHFLLARAAANGAEDDVTEQSIHGKDFHWLGMLFAVLASGAQSCELQRKERELTSQVYMCCAMECLRFVNFLSQANLEAIQTLLIIQNVLTNNMNAATAWALHGLTIRLAQGLGLHHPCPPSIPHDVVYPRSKIWWAIVWQDSLLSIIYDRASGVAVTRTTMPMPMHFGPVSAYHKAMYPLAKVGLEIVRDRGRVHEMSTKEIQAKITQHRDYISQIMRDSAEYLRDSRLCTSPQQTLEHWGLYLHTAYSLSELCRPAISPRYADRELMNAYKPLCVENLINTVEAYLGLNNITSYARQSWAALHRGLGSALLLGILGEHNKNDRARHMLTRFIGAVQEITTNVNPQEIAAPLQRGISALRRLSIAEGTGQHEVMSNDGLALDDDGSLKLERTSIYTPVSNPDLLPPQDEHSPYSVLNTILWGQATGPQPV